MKKSFLIAMALAVIVVLVAACTKPQPEPTPTPVAIGMKPGERYHDIHTDKLKLKCELCHSKVIGTYYDPLAQISNAADKRACLSCHKEGTVQPFYGESWDKAKLK